MPNPATIIQGTRVQAKRSLENSNLKIKDYKMKAVKFLFSSLGILILMNLSACDSTNSNIQNKTITFSLFEAGFKNFLCVRID